VTERRRTAIVSKRGCIVSRPFAVRRGEDLCYSMHADDADAHIDAAPSDGQTWLIED